MINRVPASMRTHETLTGTRVLLHLTAGSKEDAETVTAFFQDMRARGLATRCSWSRTARSV